MSSHSSLQRYDVAATKEYYQRSTGPQNYRLDPTYATSCQECFPIYGPSGFKGSASAPGHLVDIDSTIRGFTKIHSKSNKQQEPDPLKYNVEYAVDCNPFLETEYSRFTNPIQNYRGITRDPFYKTIYDPQCHIFWDFSENTKLRAKDEHITEWTAPLVNGDRDVRPTVGRGSRSDCKKGSYCQYAAFNS